MLLESEKDEKEDGIGPYTKVIKFYPITLLTVYSRQAEFFFSIGVTEGPAWSYKKYKMPGTATQ